jgi:hypothetical protein
MASRRALRRTVVSGLEIGPPGRRAYAHSLSKLNDVVRGLEDSLQNHREDFLTSSRARGAPRDRKCRPQSRWRTCATRLGAAGRRDGEGFLARWWLPSGRYGELVAWVQAGLERSLVDCTLLSEDGQHDGPREPSRPQYRSDVRVVLSEVMERRA